MDTSKDKIVRRLDQTTSLDYKLDQLMGRLDGVSNILESQNQKQQLLEVKLSEMTSKLEEEKMFMRNQLKQAQDEILDNLRYLKTQSEGALPVSKSDLSVAGQDLYQPNLSRPAGNDGINEIKDQLKTLNRKTDLMSSQITETTNTCKNLAKSTSKIEIQLEETFTGRDQERENVKTYLDEIIHIPEVVKGQTRAELVWLSNQIDNKWMGVADQRQKQADLQEPQNQAYIDLETKVDKLYNLTSDMESELEALKDMVIKNMHKSTEKDKINSKCIFEVNIQLHSISNLVLERSDEVNRELERGIETVIRVTDTAKDDLLRVLTNSDVTQARYWGKLQGEIEQVKTSITSLAEHLDTVEKCMATVVQKIDSVKVSLNGVHKTVKEDLEKRMATVVQKIESVEKSLNDGHNTVKEDLLALKQGQDLVTTKIEQSTNEVKDDLYRSKREIFAVTEKEAQIVRNGIEGPLLSLGKYSFDFYINNFKNLVWSGTNVYSPPWRINEAKASMTGLVWFQADGNILVSFYYGRHPLEIGLQPRPASRLKVKATICDVWNKLLPDIVLGEEIVNLNDTIISHNNDWGRLLGVTSGDDLINNGYGWKEGYKRRAILVRYDVTVL